MQKSLIVFFILASLFSKQGAAETVPANKGTPDNESIQLLYFTASWCGPCQMMKQDTWPNPLVQKALASYAFTTVDVDAEPKVAKQWAVRSMPTYLIVDATGQHELARMSGFMDAHRMATWLTGAHAQAKRTLQSILKAKLLYQKHTQQMEPLLDESIDTETLKTSQAALYTLLEHRNNLEVASTKALEQHLSEVARTHPERLLAGILHEDLQVRAYIARALRNNDIILDPWASNTDRELMVDKILKLLLAQ